MSSSSELYYFLFSFFLTRRKKKVQCFKVKKNIKCQSIYKEEIVTCGIMKYIKDEQEREKKKEKARVTESSCLILKKKNKIFRAPF